MLTDLDAELFPDDCEVVEIPLHNQYVYLMHKNGSSSLRQDAKINGWRTVRNHELIDLDSVDIYLRDPCERYLSGLNTFVQHLLRDNGVLDQTTCEILATRYNFLNRHFLPQWHWLVNLARFTKDDCQFRLHSLDDLVSVTNRRSRAGITPLAIDKGNALLSMNDKLEFWFLLDRILCGRCGQQLTWQQILQIYQDHPARPMLVVQERMEAVRRVLC